MSMMRVVVLLLLLPTTVAFTHVIPSSTRQGSALFAKTKASSSSSSSRVKKIANLSTWAKNVAEIKVSSGLTIAADDNGGLGLESSGTSSDANSILISVPSKMALSVPGTAIPGVSSSTLRKAPWFVQFSLLLHSLKSGSSKGGGGDVDMQPWLDSLPRSFSTPLHWTSSTLNDELQYPHLVDAVQRQESDWKALHESNGLQSILSWNEFVWGCECARSRAFSGFAGSAFNPTIYAFTLLLISIYVGAGLGTLEQAANGAGLVLCASIFKDFILPKLFSSKKYIICPFIDTANHAALDHNADVSFEFFGDAYSLASTAAIAANGATPVTISYGARSNDQWLQYYGFVESDNPHDVYVLPPLRDWNIRAIETACHVQVRPGRLEKLNRAGLLGSGTASDKKDSDNDFDNDNGNPNAGVVVTRVEGLDPAVVQALRALVSTEAEWEAAGEAIGNFAAEASPENEARALLVAKTQLQLELASKATTLEQDLELFQNAKNMEEEDRLALQFRIEKKKLLQETIDKL